MKPGVWLSSDSPIVVNTLPVMSNRNTRRLAASATNRSCSATAIEVTSGDFPGTVHA